MTSEAVGHSGAGRLKAAWRSGPLAVRDFRLLSLGQLTSTIGDFCYAVALPWLVLSTHGGPVLLGTVLACYGVPRTVLIPVGGILADKIGARTVMLAADAVRCVLVALLALIATRPTTSLAMLGPVAALLGAGEGVFLPASFTIMPAILGPDKLQGGNALSAAMVQVGSLAGPVLGGLLVSTVGPAPAFAVDAASFAISAAALALITARRSPAPAGQPEASDDASLADRGGAAEMPAIAAVPGTAADGTADSTPDRTPDSTPDRTPGNDPDHTPGNAPTVWALLRRSRLLKVLLGVCVAANFASGGTFEVAMPALAHARFGAAGYGAMVACFGAGAVIGTLAAVRSGALRRPAMVACSSFLLAAVAICLVPFLDGLVGASAAILIAGICNGFGNIVMITLLQQWAPSRLLGRVMSLVMLASLGSFPVSVAVSGVLVRHLGPAPFFPVAGLLLAVSIAAALTQRELRYFGATEPGDPAGLSAEAA